MSYDQGVMVTLRDGSSVVMTPQEFNDWAFKGILPWRALQRPSEADKFLQGGTVKLYAGSSDSPSKLIAEIKSPTEDSP